MIEVELSDGTIAEFPDEMSQSDIKSVLQKKFSPAPSGPSIGDIATQPQFEIPSTPDMPYGPAPTATLTSPWYEGLPWTEEGEIGVPSTAGITPEMVPQGRRLTEMMIGVSPQVGAGLREEVPMMKALDIPMTVGSSIAKTGIGLGEYLGSPQGVTELVLSLSPAKLLVMAKWAKDMAGGAGAEAGALSNLLTKPNKTAEDWQEISDRTVNMTVMAFGAGGLAKRVGTKVSRAVEPASMKAIRELESALATTEPAVPFKPPTPLRQLGIPQAPLTAEPFLQPGVPELASAALREAQGPRLEIPGQLTALEQLRRELEPPQISLTEPTRLAERIPGGGEAPYGKVSYMREAEAPTTEATQKITTAEKSILQSLINEEAAKGAAFEQAKLPGGVSYRRPKEAPSAEEYERQRRREDVESGLISESGQYLDEPFRQVLSETVRAPERMREGVVIAEPGTGRAIEKPIPLSRLQKSRLVNALRRGASEQVIKNILRLETPENPQAMPAPIVREMRPIPPGFGEEITAPSVETVRAQRALEARQKEGEPNALQREAETVLRDVQQPQVAQEGAGRVPASEGGATTPEARQEITQPKGGDLRGLQEKGKEKEVTPTAPVTEAPITQAKPSTKQKIKWVEEDSGLWFVYKDDAYVGAIFDRGAKVAGEKNTGYDLMEDWAQGEGKVVGSAKTFQEAVRKTLELQKIDADIYEAATGTKRVIPAEDNNFPSGLPYNRVFVHNGEIVQVTKTGIFDGGRYVELKNTQTGTRYWEKVNSLPERAFEPATKPPPEGAEKPIELMTPREAIAQRESNPMSVMQAQLDAARKAIKQGSPLSGELARAYEILPEVIKAEARYKYDSATDTFVPTTERMKVSKKAWSTIAKLDALDIRQRTEGESNAIAQERRALTVQLAKEMGFTKTDLISKLESLKLPETGEGRLYSLPHPDAIKAIGRTTWNSAIDLAIGAIKAGKAIGEAIEIALSHIRKNAAGKFDEAKARANLEWTTKQEVRSAVPSTEGENVQMRKSAERATTSPMVPEPVQERIATAPESFYTQQSMKRVEDAVAGMDEGQLAAVPRDSNLYTAARLEQAKRLFERGENEAGYRVFEELEKEGTMMGQLINQFKLLKGTRPENIVRVINQTLKKSGKDVLNEKQTGEAMEIAKQSKDADTALDKATDVWRLEPTTKNAAKAEQALLDANAAGLKLQRFINRFQPRSTAGVIKSVLQGNLLTPISEVANIVGNFSFLQLRGMARTAATALDILDNYIKGTPRQITVQPIRGTIEAAKGAARGALQIPDIFMRGTGNVIKGESRAGLHPLKAWINQFSKNPELPTTGGKLTLGDRLNLLIEGTFGIPAEAMLRGLGAGDVPFKEAARARATATELKLANVPKAQWSFAQKFPELFLDAKAMERIKDQTLAAVFQRPSTSLNRINSIIRNNFLTSRGVSPDIMDLAASTVAPYRLTPWNVVGEILSFNPLVAAARSVNDFRIGNRLDAKMNAGKYIVGTMLTAAGWWLYKNNLMSPSLDQRDEAQKARILAGEVLPPNHINLSGLRRAMDKLKSGQKPTAEDTNMRPGDETADVFRAGGLAGSMFYMTANIGRDFERMPESKDSEILGAILRQSTLEQARFGMNQSFLSGVEGLLAAVREGNADNYLRQWANTVASVPIPNSLTVLSRTTRDYKPDFREDAFSKQVENIIRNKLGAAKMDDYLPLKRGLWGEPLRETPEGRNALVYHFFDVFKNKQVTGDPVALELFRLWRKTGDSKVIPSLPADPGRILTVANKQYPLDATQYSRFAELVGQSRRRIVDAVVVNPGFHKIPDEAKIDILEKIYDAGLRQGKAQFWVEAGSTLKEKPARAGFQPAAPGTPQ